MINIEKANRAEVLAALYNRSRQQGMGFLHERGRHPMTTEEAQKELDHLNEPESGRRCYFDYLHGRVMKIHLGKDTLETWLYDRDNGQGAALEAIKDIPGVEILPDSESDN